MDIPICSRCHKKDPHFFGDWILDSRSSQKKYLCFECQHLCKQCGLYPGEYLVGYNSNEMNICETCYRKR